MPRIIKLSILLFLLVILVIYFPKNVSAAQYVCEAPVESCTNGAGNFCIKGTNGCTCTTTYQTISTHCVPPEIDSSDACNIGGNNWRWNAATCDTDPDPGPSCGNGTCGGGETCSNCSADCGTCGPVCGDGVCSSGESCVADCDPCGGGSRSYCNGGASAFYCCGTGQYCSPTAPTDTSFSCSTTPPTTACPADPGDGSENSCLGGSSCPSGYSQVGSTTNNACGSGNVCCNRFPTACPANVGDGSVNACLPGSSCPSGSSVYGSATFNACGSGNVCCNSIPSACPDNPSSGGSNTCITGSSCPGGSSLYGSATTNDCGAGKVCCNTPPPVGATCTANGGVCRTGGGACSGGTYTPISGTCSSPAGSSCYKCVVSTPTPTVTPPSGTCPGVCRWNAFSGTCGVNGHYEKYSSNAGCTGSTPVCYTCVEGPGDPPPQCVDPGDSCGFGGANLPCCNASVNVCSNGFCNPPPPPVNDYLTDTVFFDNNNNGVMDVSPGTVDTVSSPVYNNHTGPYCDYTSASISGGILSFSSLQGCGTSYNDENGNGKFDPHDIGIANAQISDNPQGAGVTDYAGRLFIGYPVIGSHTISVAVPTGYVSTTSNPISKNVTAGANFVWLGIGRPVVTIQGRFVGANGTTQINLSGMGVTLSGPGAGGVKTATPWDYSSIQPGSYTLTASPVSGYNTFYICNQGSGCASSGLSTSGFVSMPAGGLNINLPSNGNYIDLYIQYLPIPTPTPIVLNGTVYIDNNRDGVMNGSDNPFTKGDTASYGFIYGSDASFNNWTPPPIKTTDGKYTINTAGNGNYFSIKSVIVSDTFLPSEGANLFSNYRSTSPDPAPQSPAQISWSGGIPSPNEINFGLYPAVTIQGHIKAADGVTDMNPKLPGQLVTITGPGGSNPTSASSSNSSWAFSKVWAGVYTIDIAPIAGYKIEWKCIAPSTGCTQTSYTPVPDDNTIGVNLLNGGNYADIYFRYVPQRVTLQGRLVGADGTTQVSIPGMGVTVLPGLGSKTTTPWDYTGVDPDTYTVSINQVAGYTTRYRCISVSNCNGVPTSFTPGTSVDVNLPNGGDYIDLYVQYLPGAQVTIQGRFVGADGTTQINISGMGVNVPGLGPKTITPWDYTGVTPNGYTVTINQIAGYTTKYKCISASNCNGVPTTFTTGTAVSVSLPSNGNYVDLWIQYIPTSQVTIQGRFVDTADNQVSTPGMGVSIPTVGTRNTTPWDFSGLTPGSYTVAITQIPGYVSMYKCIPASNCGSVPTVYTLGTQVNVSLPTSGNYIDLYISYVSTPTCSSLTKDAKIGNGGTSVSGNATAGQSINLFANIINDNGIHTTSDWIATGTCGTFTTEGWDTAVYRAPSTAGTCNITYSLNNAIQPACTGSFTVPSGPACTGGQTVSGTIYVDTTGDNCASLTPLGTATPVTFTRTDKTPTTLTTNTSGGNYTFTDNPNACTGTRTITIQPSSAYTVTKIKYGAAAWQDQSGYTSNPLTNATQVVNWCVSSNSPWYQTTNGDVRFSSLINKIPAGQKASPDATNPSVFFSSDDPLTNAFGLGGASAKNWQVGDEYAYNDEFVNGQGTMSYSFYNSQKRKKNITAFALSQPTYVFNDARLSGIYTKTGNLTINASAITAASTNKHIIVLVDGDVTIGGGIAVAPGQGNLFIVAAKGNITIGPGITILDGYYTAEGNITVAHEPSYTCPTPDVQLTVSGALIANSARPFAVGQSGKIINNRTLCAGNATTPSLLINSRFEFLTQLTDFYKTTVKTYKEVNP